MTKNLITVEVVFYRENRTVLAVELVRVFGLGLAFPQACLLLERDFPLTYNAVQTECTSFSATITDKV